MYFTCELFMNTAFIFKFYFIIKNCFKVGGSNN